MKRSKNLWFKANEKNSGMHPINGKGRAFGGIFFLLALPGLYSVTLVDLPNIKIVVVYLFLMALLFTILIWKSEPNPRAIGLREWIRVNIHREGTSFDTSNYGKAILEAIHNSKLKVVETYPEKGTYLISTDNFDATVEIENNWLGLELKGNIKMPNGETRLVTYTCNTDVYKFDNPANKDFIESIESDIVIAINALAEHKIQLGLYGKKPAMIVPKTDGYDFIFQGKYFRGSRTTIFYPTLEQLLKAYKFKRLYV